jgi:RNA polymerase sigma-70 factor, ECF subfamily
MCVLDRNASDRNELFVELLTLHQRTLYGFIYTFVPNAADAEDLLQQTSLVLWQKFDEFDAQRSFSAWACGIARFTVLDYLKKKRRSRVIFDDELIACLAETRRNREQVHLSDRALLAECVEELSEGDRKLIRLCYAANRTIKAAAAALDRPVASVYMSLVRVRRLLMDCIRRTSAEEGS